MPPKKSSAVIRPNLGLFLSELPIAVRDQALQAGENFRIRDGVLSNLQLGWTRLGAFQLNGPLIYMDFFFVNGVNERNLFFTLQDAYLFDPSSNTVTYVTPRYVTGTAAASGTAVTGMSTLWNTDDANGVKNAKAGDEISFGSADEQSTSATWYEVDSVNSDTSITLTASAGTVADGAYTLRRRFTGGFQNNWSSDVFIKPGGTGNDTWYGTNGIDPVVKWDGTSTDTLVFVDTSAAFSTCKCLRVYSTMMIYGAPVVSGDFFPSSIINSDVGDPEDFAGLFGQYQVYGDYNPIFNMVPIGDNLAIYSRRRVSLAQFVGDPLVFTFRQVVSDLGPIAGGLIADLGDFHEFVGPDAQYYFDGVQVRESASQVWRSILAQRDPVRNDVGFIHFNEEWGDLMWFVPLTTDTGAGTADAQPNTAFVEHYLEEVGDREESPFSKRRAPFSSAGYTENRDGQTFDELDQGWDDYNFRWNDSFFFLAFPISMMGDTAGKVWTLNTSQTDGDGAALPSYVRFGRRPTVDGRARGLLKRVYPFVSNFASDLDITVRLFESASTTSAFAEETFTFNQSQPQEGHFQEIYRRARFYELQFGSALGLPWALEGFDKDLAPGGRR